MNSKLGDDFVATTVHKLPVVPAHGTFVAVHRTQVPSLLRAHSKSPSDRQCDICPYPISSDIEPVAWCPTSWTPYFTHLFLDPKPYRRPSTCVSIRIRIPRATCRGSCATCVGNPSRRLSILLVACLIPRSLFSVCTLTLAHPSIRLVLTAQACTAVFDDIIGSVAATCVRRGEVFQGPSV